MSGIVGILNPNGLAVDRVLLEQMTRSMSFRGPDAQTWWSDGHVGLGHALLRTTRKVEAVRQPYTLEGQVVITGDVRLDRRAELNDRLQARGRHLPAEAADIELVLAAYAEWDTRCVEYLFGDFVFAVWDARTQQLFCAHDQFGVLPFYYAQVNGSLIFSNTPNCIRMLPAVSDELNEQAIADWLLFRNNQDATTTTFCAIRRLPPAHSLTCAEGVIRCQRYWSLPEQIEVRYGSAAETVTRFQELFIQAVADRLGADRIVVPMSGGMDSSSVAVTAQRLLTQTHQNDVLRAFTLTLDHLMPDRERYYAGLVAKHANIPIEFVRYAFADEIDLAGAAKHPPEPGSIPIPDRNEMPDQDSAPGTITLSGTGGDPIFLPSQTFLPNLLKHGQLDKFVRVMQQQFQIQGTLPPLYLRSGFKRRFEEAKIPPLPRWLNPSFAARLDLPRHWIQATERMEARDPRRGMAESPFWSNFFAHWDPGYTYKPSKVRYPFFDVRLLSFVLTLPPVPWFVSKTLLREAMRGALPEEVRRRPKAPLSRDPLYQRAQTGTPAWMIELANTPELEPYVNRKALLHIIETPAQVTGREFSRAQAPLALAYWLRGESKRSQKSSV